MANFTGRGHEIIMACLLLGISCSFMLNGVDCNAVGRRRLIGEKVSNIIRMDDSNGGAEDDGQEDGAPPTAPPPTMVNGVAVHDVMKFGAKANGVADDGIIFIRTWRAACDSTDATPQKVLIPKGNYMAGEVIFAGPCKAKGPITIEIQGNISANTEPGTYTQGAWIMVERVQHVIVNGGGTIDGKGEASWKHAGGDGPPLAVSLIFQTVGFSKMHDLNFVNSMGFHVKVTDSYDMELNNLKITAPGKSPNTDGIHMSNATNVNITNSVIGTGDDCVSIGHGTKNVLVSNVFCGPGHGISVGSLGKRPDEMNVDGITIVNCTINGTTNGARIKTYHASPHLTATNIVFQDIVMTQVKNPIIIDQHYDSKTKREQSNVEISNVRFANIHGTTISQIPINLNCSSSHPCKGIELSNIDLAPFSGAVLHGPLTSTCSSAITVVKGNVKPEAPAKCT